MKNSNLTNQETGGLDFEQVFGSAWLAKKRSGRLGLKASGGKVGATKGGGEREVVKDPGVS